MADKLLRFEKKAEDNLNYETNKTLKLLDNFAGLVDRKMNMGAGVDMDDLQLLSSEYMKLKEKGVDVSGLDNKINQKMIERGKDPLEERLGKEKEA